MTDRYYLFFDGDHLLYTTQRPPPVIERVDVPPPTVFRVGSCDALTASTPIARLDVRRHVAGVSLPARDVRAAWEARPFTRRPVASSEADVFLAMLDKEAHDHEPLPQWAIDALGFEGALHVALDVYGVTGVEQAAHDAQRWLARVLLPRPCDFAALEALYHGRHHGPLADFARAWNPVP